jgi:transcriptional regulator with XRE-family HTH domain
MESARMAADDIKDVFRSNMLRLMTERRMTPAELSRRAGLNLRAVTDIRDGRSQSPKLSTLFAISSALGVELPELLGFGGTRLEEEFHRLLSRYDRADQERILAVLRALPLRPPSTE